MNYANQLLSVIKHKYQLSPEVMAAFEKCPRHLFIKRPYGLEEMYQDYPLEIYRDEKFISTISQPSFVLLMLELLELRPSHKVLEVGTGSGWNAALMSTLCELVVSLEIIPSLALETRENLRQLGFKNVIVIEGDAAFGEAKYAPYDRGVFTAGATDLPRAFHEQIKTGGILLFVLKTASGDLLLSLRKEEGYFEERQRILCSFVPMVGEKKADRAFMFESLPFEGKRIRIYPNLSGSAQDSVITTA